MNENGFWITLIALACFFMAGLSYWATTTAKPNLNAMSGPPEGLSDEAVWVTMAQLADFPCEDVAHSKELLQERIPESIQSLSGKSVVIDGWMLPITVERDGKVTDFFLFRHMADCCFGGSPLPTDFIYVTMKEGSHCWAGFAYEIVRTEGVLDVGVESDELGNISSVYRLTAEKADKTTSN